MAVHEIKIRRQWYDRVADGSKRAEVRYLDRDYQVGDTLRLVPLMPAIPGTWLTGVSTPDTSLPVLTVRITHILYALPRLGLQRGWGVLSHTSPDPDVDG